jgi:2-keto-4-pentenoate hydratase/2-oxohepta-3-ene-1,7-dioic acid hydratase in catechol pathway
MRIATIDGRAVLVRGDEVLDIAEASGGTFGPDPAAVYEQWSAFRNWAAGAAGTSSPLDEARLGPPSPTPRQVFAVGVNYKDHAEEGHAPLPSKPVVFTKFPTCLGAPTSTVTLESESVDWEAELVVVIGEGGHRIPRDEAWDRVAGLAVGQDLSDRVVQLNYERAQFSLGKSFPGFGPFGPWIVTPDEIENRDDLAVRCTINGAVRQDFRTARMIFPVAEIIHELSQIVTLLPGDVIFTGTSGGVGMLADPPEYLKPGDVVITTIDGIGTLHTSFVGA